MSGSPMGTTGSTRPLMQTIADGVRGYFAPVNRAMDAPVAFSVSEFANAMDAPPVGWFDVGLLANFERKSSNEILSARSGGAGVSRFHLRTATDSVVAFDFCEWGKLQMGIAAPSQQMNVIPAGTAAASVNDGSTASMLRVSDESISQFNVGDLVAVDVDYTDQVGFIGTGAAGGFVRESVIRNDPDYVRRVTLNVSRVASIETGVLMLDKPLIGGSPTLNAKVQKVIGFEDREGSTYVQQWSALFVMQSASGGLLCFYYPRLQTKLTGETLRSIDAELQQMFLHAEMAALPERDQEDGEQILCRRIFIPKAQAPSY